MNENLNPEEKEVLRVLLEENLGKGDRAAVARQFEVHRNTVYEALKNFDLSSELFEACVARAVANKERRKNSLENLNKLRE